MSSAVSGAGERTAENADRALAACDADAIVASDPFTVAWLTGFAADALSGPSPFAAAPLAVVDARGRRVLVVSSDEVSAAEASGWELCPYEGFTAGPLDPHARQHAVLAELRVQGRVAVEPHALTVSLASLLPPDAVDASAALRRLRAVKTEAEVASLRAAIELCDAGQAAARAAARPGLSELALWSAAAAAMEEAAGERLPVLADLVTGPRTAEVGGAPGRRALGVGDLVLCDLVPRRTGMWGDSCATFAVGTPSQQAREAHDRVHEVLGALVAALRPGAVAGDLDRLGRSTGLDYPHHTGHGLGRAAHEEPRLVPGGETVLEPGMVVALEPGLYTDELGVRLEQVCLITEAGVEVLSAHRLELEQGD